MRAAIGKIFKFFGTVLNRVTLEIWTRSNAPALECRLYRSSGKSFNHHETEIIPNPVLFQSVIWRALTQANLKIFHSCRWSDWVGIPTLEYENESFLIVPLNLDLCGTTKFFGTVLNRVTLEIL